MSRSGDAQLMRAYSGRALEYTDRLGSLDQRHESDRRTIAQWSSKLGNGPALDAGCGPGHWTAYLRSLGVKTSGIDLVPEFIENARARYPEVPFTVGSMSQLGLHDDSLRGILAWYSLIHTPSHELLAILEGFHRALAPDGQLLVGFFEGPSAEPFDHAIATAYYWSVDAMSSVLTQAGFDNFEIERRADAGRRPHAAISATAFKTEAVS